MEEILALQKQLAAVQMQDSAHRISERNAVEIILKLIESQKVELIFTASGKEYVTPKQLRREIQDEILSHGGRVSLVDIAANLGVDMNHIETHSNAILREDKSLILVNGQVIADYYLDGICEEINEALQEAGQLTVTSQASKFALPVDLLMSVVEQRIASGVMAAQLRQAELFTQAFVTRHNARVRGVFSAVTRPTPFRQLVQQHQLLDGLAWTEVNRLIDARLLPATLKGAETRAVYTPLGFTKTQDAGIASFYQMNGYIEFDKLKRMAIADPRAYLKKQFPQGMELETCWLSADTVLNVSASVEDAVDTAGKWIHVTPLLPAPLSRADVALVLKRILERKLPGAATGKTDAATGDEKATPKLTKTASKAGASSAAAAAAAAGSSAMKAVQLSQVYAVSDAFVLWCQEQLKPFVKKSVEFATQKLQKKGGSKKGGDDEDGDDGGEDDDDDDDAASTTSSKSSKSTSSSASKAKASKASSKSKKAAEGDDDDGDDGSDDELTGAKARKAKRQAKAAKASGKKAPASSSASKKASSKSSGSSKGGAGGAETALTIEALATELSSKFKKTGKSKTDDDDDDSGSGSGVPPAELLTSLVRQVRPALVALWNELHASVVSGGETDRRAFVDRLTTALQQLYEHLQIFHESSQALLPGAASKDDDAKKGGKGGKGGDKGADKKAKASTAAAGKTEGEGEGVELALVRSLQRYLLKTIGAQSMDLVLRGAAVQNDFAEDWVTGASDAPAPAAAADAKDAKSAPAAAADLAAARALTPKERQEILKKCPAPLSKLLQSTLNKLGADASAAEFMDGFEKSASACDVRLRPLDRKKERNLIFTVRRGIMSDLSTEADPVAVLHSTVTVVHSQLTNLLLHCPARSLGSVLALLKGKIDDKAYQQLLAYHALATRYTAALKAEQAGGSAAAAAAPAPQRAQSEGAEGEAPSETAALDAELAALSTAELKQRLDAGLAAIRAFGENPKLAMKGAGAGTAAAQAAQAAAADE